MSPKMTLLDKIVFFIAILAVFAASILSFVYLGFVVALIFHVVLSICFLLQLQIAYIYNKLIIQATQKSSEVMTQSIDSVEFSDSPITFWENQIYQLIISGKLDVSSYYEAVLQFLSSRAKTETSIFKNMPADLIPILLEKAYSCAKNKSTGIEFENLDGIFDDEASKLD